MHNRLPQHIILLLSILICGNSIAQTPVRKPDKIFKGDQTIMEVLIEEVNKTDIAYKKLSDPKGPLYAIPKKDVWKIIWNNGEIEEVNPPVTATAKARKPTDLIVSKKKAEEKFWEKSGLYAGARIGAGLSFMPESTGLIKGTELAYSGGIAVGLHKKALGIQIQALYTQLGFGVSVPLGSTGEVTSIKGTQSQLLLPLTVMTSQKAGPVRIGVSVGAFGVIQVGAGGLKVSDANGSSTVKNCDACSDKDLGFGVTGGIGVTILEGPRHAIFINADWYYNLGENKDYRPGETSVKTHLGLLSAGVLLHFPGQH
ncbi:hypothetical protein MUK70_15440 [Dyadobacter chenwenxiniae]|uniref:Outer membrane protein beta-barrel domain-containing protein n=1 Tax=Dyadobacter chenwenxiniae TaxID=2906456 RepID=A0A9X1PKU4_9BACT|nr:hypothetical protein [Dyadobacter chenwenxiniae]MCF0060636.1 hypothetical protein [Dyadobacter chenwenxiniae]UON80468.1 hypothetical protein MUK70_15440 [Dyadobacter chenwenxiniae]